MLSAAASVPVPIPAGIPTAAIPVIDTHTHFYDPTRPGGVPWPPESDAVLYQPHLPEQFRAASKDFNVAGTVVIEASAWLEDNQWVLDLAKDNPVIVGFIGNLPMGKPEFASSLERFGANPIFRGLRLHADVLVEGLGRKPFENDLKRLSDRRLTIDLLGDAGMIPDAIRLAGSAPNLRVVLDHLPFNVWDGQPAAMREALREAAKLPNLYAKVSAAARRTKTGPVTDPGFYQPGLDVLWELFGPDRAMYGSNWPVSNLVTPYAGVYQIVKNYFSAHGKAAAEKFFWKNSLAAYGWQPRGAAAALVR